MLTFGHSPEIFFFLFSFSYPKYIVSPNLIHGEHFGAHLLCPHLPYILLSLHVFNDEEANFFMKKMMKMLIRSNLSATFFYVVDLCLLFLFTSEHSFKTYFLMSITSFPKSTPILLMQLSGLCFSLAFIFD